MTTEKKLELLEEMFDMDKGTLAPATLLDDLEWDSMAKLSLIVMMDDECDKQLNGDQIRAFVKIQDILDFMD